MSTGTKSLLFFVGGIVTGVILTLAVLFFIALGSVSKTSSNDGVVLFEEPQQEISVKSFEIFQVLPDGSALATAQDYANLGMVVMFLAEKGVSYYDSQKINVPSDKRVLQIGTYRYETRNKIEKTVPIIKIVDK